MGGLFIKRTLSYKKGNFMHKARLLMLGVIAAGIMSLCCFLVGQLEAEQGNWTLELITEYLNEYHQIEVSIVS